MAYLVAGPFVALVGIVAVFFVLRRKPQEETIPASTSAFATQVPRATVSWETPAYGAPPVAPPSAPPSMPPPPPGEAPAGAPWDVPAAASAPAPTFDYPP